MLLVIMLVIWSGIFLAVKVGAASGDVDASFNPSADGNNLVYAVALQPDGKVVMTGKFTEPGGAGRNRTARLNTDGALDATFNSSVDANGEAFAVATQPDGKILIGGSFSIVGGVARTRIARLNSDGTLDTSFDTSIGANGTVYAITLQPDGKILIGGPFSTVNGEARSGVARLNADGSLDTSFNANAGGASMNGIVVQPDGKIVVGGTFTSIGGAPRGNVARLNPDGSLDATFDANVSETNNFVIITGVAVQADGKVIVVGSFTAVNGVARKGIARINSDGSLDAAFDTDTGAAAPYAVAVRPDGRIIIAGLFTTVDGVARKYIARLNPDGNLDTTFDTSIGANNFVRSIALHADGKTVIGGSFTTVGGVTRKGVARLQNSPGRIAFAAGAVNVSEDAGMVSVAVTRTGGTDNTVTAKVTAADSTAVKPDDYRFAPGATDTSFDTSIGANNSVFVSALQPDGKTIIGGLFTTVGGVARNRIARLNTDGSLDTSFNPGTGASGSVSAIALQPDGKILIGGIFTTVNGAARKRIARLNTDGSVDLTFDTSVGASAAVYAVAVRPDGKILIGGAFTTIDNTGRNYIAQLNSNGSLDGAFNPGTGASDNVFAVAVQPDGKVVIGGEFATVNGVARNLVARLNSDGSLDASFDAGVLGTDFVLAVTLQPDGKILIGGEFETVDGTTRNNIARLNPNGDVDTTFDTNTGADATVRAIALQPDGKIIIGGDFTTAGGAARNRIARLDTDGSIDTAFNPGAGADNLVFAVAVQADGKVIVGGGFATIDGATRNRIARLDNDIFVTFPAGDATSKSIQLPIVNDSTTEGNESFTLTLSPASGGASIGTPATTTVNILANDAPPVVLTPVADTWVQGAEAFRDTNFGASAEMQVKRTLNPGTGRGRRGLLRFDTASVAGAITSAKLRIFARLTDASLPPTGMIIQKITNTAWNELAVTWNAQPNVESFNPLAQITVTGATGQYYEFDLTSFIQAERAAGRAKVAFRLINVTSTGNSGASYTIVNSKEAAENPPQLVLQP